MEPEDWLDDTYDQAEESTEYSGMHGHKTELDDSEVFNPTVANRPMGGSPYRNGEGVTNTTGTTGATDTTAKDKTGVTKYPGWEYNPSTRKYYNPNDSSDYNNPNYKYEEGGDDFLENLRKRTQEEAKIEQEQLRISRDGYDFAKPNTREKQLSRFGNTYQTMDEKYLGFLSEQKENERLGIADTRAKYLADNRLENQGAGEATWNAIKRTGVGAFYKTVSGISGMFDIEDHMNQDDEIGNWLSNWADEGNIEYQNDNRIYTSDNKSFSSLNWWLKNGSDLSASMISFMLQAQVMARLGPAAPLAGLSKLLKLGKAAKYLRSAAGIANTASKTRKAVAGVEAVAGAAATAKKVSGVATAAESAALAATNAKKASTVVGLAESAAVKAGTTGTGLSGAAISRGQDILEYTQDGITAYMLNQSESIMSAAPIYKEAYDEAIRRGHGTEYAKQVAALAGSTVISTNRANFVLNMTSVGKIMKASGLRSAGVSAPATWGKTIKSVGFESGQEAVEESINYLGELSGKMAYQGVLDKGAKMDTSFATYGKSEDTTLASRLVSAAAVLSPAGALYGFYDGVTAGADILTGKLGGVGNNGRNSWNSVDWGDLAESAFLGAMGGAGQTMMTDGVVGRLGSSSGWLSKVPGLNYVNSRLFGQKKEQRWETNSTQLGDDGQPLYKKGDIKYEMEDDIATENVSYKKGELADRDINYNSPKVDANGTPIMRKVETTNADGTKLVTEVPDTDKVTIAKQGEVITDEMIASMTSQNIFKETKGQVKYQRNADGTLKTKEPVTQGGPEPIYLNSQRIKKDAKGKDAPLYEKDAKGNDRTYSRNELEKVNRDEIEARMLPFKESLMKQFTINEHAKLANTIGNASQGLSQLMDKNLSGADRAFLINKVAEQLAIINLVKKNPSYTKEDFIAEKAKVVSQLNFSKDNLTYMMDKQDELDAINMDRQAMLAFETGTEEILRQVFKDIMKMTPEQAAEKGYGADYKQQAQAHLDMLTKRKNQYVEMTSKHGPRIGKVLYMNRAAYDHVMDNAQKAGESIRGEISDKTKELTDLLFSGEPESSLKLKNLIDKISALQAELATLTDPTLIKINYEGKKITVADARNIARKKIVTEERKKKSETINAENDANQKELEELEEQLGVASRDAEKNKDLIKEINDKIEKNKELGEKIVEKDEALEMEMRNELSKEEKIIQDEVEKETDRLKKEYKDKINKAYEEDTLNDNGFNEKFAKEMSKPESKSALLSLSKDVSEIKDKKNRYLLEAKELNDEFDRLTDKKTAGMQLHASEMSKARVRNMLREIGNAITIMLENNANIETSDEETDGSVKYYAVGYRNVVTKVTDENGVEVEIVTRVPFKHVLHGTIELNAAGALMFRPVGESDFVVATNEELEFLKDIIVPGAEGKAKLLVEQLNSLNEQLQTLITEQLANIAEQKSIEKKISDIDAQLANKSTDSEKLKEDRKALSIELFDVKNKIAKTDSEIKANKKRIIDLGEALKPNTFFKTFTVEDNKGTDNEGFASVSMRSNGIRQIGMTEAEVSKAYMLDQVDEENKQSILSVEEYYNRIMSIETMTLEESIKSRVRTKLTKMLNDRAQRAAKRRDDLYKEYKENNEALDALKEALLSKETLSELLKDNFDYFVKLALKNNYSITDLMDLGLTQTDAELIKTIAEDKSLLSFVVQDESDLIEAEYAKYRTEFTRMKEKVDALKKDTLDAKNKLANIEKALKNLYKKSKDLQAIGGDNTELLLEIEKLKQSKIEITTLLDKCKELFEEKTKELKELNERNKELEDLRIEYTKKSNTTILEFLNAKIKTLTDAIETAEANLKVAKSLKDANVANNIKNIVLKARAEMLAKKDSAFARAGINKAATAMFGKLNQDLADQIKEMLVTAIKAGKTEESAKAIATIKELSLILNGLESQSSSEKVKSLIKASALLSSLSVENNSKLSSIVNEMLKASATMEAFEHFDKQSKMVVIDKFIKDTSNEKGITSSKKYAEMKLQIEAAKKVRNDLLNNQREGFSTDTALNSKDANESAEEIAKQKYKRLTIARAKYLGDLQAVESTNVAQALDKVKNTIEAQENKRQVLEGEIRALDAMVASINNMLKELDTKNSSEIAAMAEDLSIEKLKAEYEATRQEYYDAINEYAAERIKLAELSKFLVGGRRGQDDTNLSNSFNTEDEDLEDLDNRFSLYEEIEELMKEMIESVSNIDNFFQNFAKYNMIKQVAKSKSFAKMKDVELKKQIEKIIEFEALIMSVLSDKSQTLSAEKAKEIISFLDVKNPAIAAELNRLVGVDGMSSFDKVKFFDFVVKELTVKMIDLVEQRGREVSLDIAKDIAKEKGIATKKAFEDNDLGSVSDAASTLVDSLNKMREARTKAITSNFEERKAFTDRSASVESARKMNIYAVATLIPEIKAELAVKARISGMALGLNTIMTDLLKTLEEAKNVGNEVLVRQTERKINSITPVYFSKVNAIELAENYPNIANKNDADYERNMAYASYLLSTEIGKEYVDRKRERDNAKLKPTTNTTNTTNTTTSSTTAAQVITSNSNTTNSTSQSITEKQNKIDALNKSIELKKKSLKTVTDRYNDLKTYIEIFAEAISKTSNFNSKTFNPEIKNLVAKFNSLRTLEERESFLADLKVSTELINNELLTIKNSIDSETEQVRILTEEISDEKSKNSNTTANTKTSVTNNINTLKSKVEARKKSIKDRTNNEKILSDRFDRLEELLYLLIRVIDESKLISKKSTDSEISNLISKFNSLKSEKEREDFLKNFQDTPGKVYNDLQKERDLLEKDKKELAREEAELKEETERVDKEIADNKAKEIEAIKVDTTSKDSSNSTTNLQNKSNNSSVNDADKNKKIEALENKIVTTKEDIRNIKFTIKQLGSLSLSFAFVLKKALQYVKNKSIIDIGALNVINTDIIRLLQGFNEADGEFTRTKILNQILAKEANINKELKEKELELSQKEAELENDTKALKLLKEESSDDLNNSNEDTTSHELLNTEAQELAETISKTEGQVFTFQTMYSQLANFLSNSNKLDLSKQIEIDESNNSISALISKINNETDINKKKELIALLKETLSNIITVIENSVKNLTELQAKQTELNKKIEKEKQKNQTKKEAFDSINSVTITQEQKNKVEDTNQNTQVSTEVTTETTQVETEQAPVIERVKPLNPVTAYLNFPSADGKFSSNAEFKTENGESFFELRIDPNNSNRATFTLIKSQMSRIKGSGSIYLSDKVFTNPGLLFNSEYDDLIITEGVIERQGQGWVIMTPITVKDKNQKVVEELAKERGVSVTIELIKEVRSGKINRPIVPVQTAPVMRSSSTPTLGMTQGGVEAELVTSVNLSLLPTIVGTEKEEEQKEDLANSTDNEVVFEPVNLSEKIEGLLLFNKIQKAKEGLLNTSNYTLNPSNLPAVRFQYFLNLMLTQNEEDSNNSLSVRYIHFEENEKGELIDKVSELVGNEVHGIDNKPLRQRDKNYRGENKDLKSNVYAIMVKKEEDNDILYAMMKNDGNLLWVKESDLESKQKEGYHFVFETVTGAEGVNRFGTNTHLNEFVNNDDVLSMFSNRVPSKSAFVDAIGSVKDILAQVSFDFNNAATSKRLRFGADKCYNENPIYGIHQAIVIVDGEEVRYDVDPLFYAAFCESNANIKSNLLSKNGGLETLPIWQAIVEANKGNVNFDEKAQFELLKSTFEFFIAGHNLMAKKLNDFRNEIVNSKLPQFSYVSGVTLGNKERSSKDRSPINQVFSKENFMSRNTVIGTFGVTDTGIDERQKGLFYISWGNGLKIETYAGTNTVSDILTITKLMDLMLSNDTTKVTKVSKGDKTVRTVKLRVYDKDGRPTAQFIERQVSGSNSIADNIAYFTPETGDRSKKMAFYLTAKGFAYINESGEETLLQKDVYDTITNLSEAQIKEILNATYKLSETKKLAVQNFLKFLQSKNKQVSYSSKNNTTENYLHPFVDENGNMAVKRYNSFKEFLYETNTLLLAIKPDVTIINGVREGSDGLMNRLETPNAYASINFELTNEPTNAENIIEARQKAIERKSQEAKVEKGRNTYKASEERLFNINDKLANLTQLANLLTNDINVQAYLASDLNEKERFEARVKAIKQMNEDIKTAKEREIEESKRKQESQQQIQARIDANQKAINENKAKKKLTNEDVKDDEKVIYLEKPIIPDSDFFNTSVNVFSTVNNSNNFQFNNGLFTPVLKLVNYYGEDPKSHKNSNDTNNYTTRVYKRKAFDIKGLLFGEGRVFKLVQRTPQLYGIDGKLLFNDTISVKNEISNNTESYIVFNPEKLEELRLANIVDGKHVSKLLNDIYENIKNYGNYKEIDGEIVMMMGGNKNHEPANYTAVMATLGEMMMPKYYSLKKYSVDTAFNILLKLGILNKENKDSKDFTIGKVLRDLIDNNNVPPELRTIISLGRMGTINEMTKEEMFNQNLKFVMYNELLGNFSPSLNNQKYSQMSSINWDHPVFKYLIDNKFISKEQAAQLDAEATAGESNGKDLDETKLAHQELLYLFSFKDDGKMTNQEIAEMLKTRATKYRDTSVEKLTNGEATPLRTESLLAFNYDMSNTFNVDKTGTKNVGLGMLISQIKRLYPYSDAYLLLEEIAKSMTKKGMPLPNVKIIAKIPGQPVLNYYSHKDNEIIITETSSSQDLNKMMIIVHELFHAALRNSTDTVKKKFKTEISVIANNLINRLNYDELASFTNTMSKNEKATFFNSLLAMLQNDDSKKTANEQTIWQNINANNINDEATIEFIKKQLEILKANPIEANEELFNYMFNSKGVANYLNGIDYDGAQTMLDKFLAVLKNYFKTVMGISIKPGSYLQKIISTDNVLSMNTSITNNNAVTTNNDFQTESVSEEDLLPFSVEENSSSAKEELLKKQKEEFAKEYNSKKTPKGKLVVANKIKEAFGEEEGSKFIEEIIKGNSGKSTNQNNLFNSSYDTTDDFDEENELRKYNNLNTEYSQYEYLEQYRLEQQRNSEEELAPRENIEKMLSEAYYSSDLTTTIVMDNKTFQIDSSKLEEIVEGVTTIFMRKIRQQGYNGGGVNPNLSIISDPSKLFSEVTNIQEFYDEIFAEISMNYDSKAESDPQLKDILIDLGQKGKSLKMKRDLLNRFKKNMKSLDITISNEVDEYSDDNVKDAAFNRESYMSSPYDMTHISLRLLIYGLPKYTLEITADNKVGIKENLNNSGFPRLIDGSSLINVMDNITKNLPINHPDINPISVLKKEYFSKKAELIKLVRDLTKQGKFNKWEQLVSEADLLLLSLSQVFENSYIYYDETTNEEVDIKQDLLSFNTSESGRIHEDDSDNITFINEFLQRFSKAHNVFVNVKVNEDAEQGMTVYDANEKYTERAIVNDWKNSISAARNNEGELEELTLKAVMTINDKFKIADKAKKQAELYNDFKAFMRLFGVEIKTRNMTEFRTAYDSLKEDTAVKWYEDVASFVNYITNRFRDDSKELEKLKYFNLVASMDETSDKAKAQANFIRNIAKVESISITPTDSKSFTTADGQKVHAVNLNSNLTTVTSDINFAKSKEELIKAQPHLGSVYARNSLFLNKMFETTGSRNENVNIQSGYSSGLLDEKGGNVMQDMKANDKIIMDIASAMRSKSPLMPLLRAADRSSESNIQLVNKNGQLHNWTAESYPLIFSGYLKDEMAAMVTHVTPDKIISSYGTSGANRFRLFDKTSTTDNGLLGDLYSQTLAKVEEIRNTNLTLEDKVKAVDAYVDSINYKLSEVFSNYFDKKGKELIEYMRKNGFIGNDFTIPLTHLRTNSNYEKMSKYIGDYLITSMVGYVEQTKLFIGDPLFYSNVDAIFKRIKMFNATKKVNVMTKEMRNKFNKDIRVTFKNGETSFDVKMPSEYNDNTQPVWKIAKLLDKAQYDLKKLSQSDLDYIGEINSSLRANIMKILENKQARITPEFSIAWQADGIWKDTFDTIILNDVEFTSATLGTWTQIISEETGKKVDISKLKVKLDGKMPIYFLEGNPIDGKVSYLIQSFVNGFINDGMTDEIAINTKLQSFIEPFYKINEADGESYCTLPYYKSLLKSSGKQWNKQLEKSYQKAIQGKDLSEADYRNLKLDGFKGAFSKLKTHASGALSSYGDYDMSTGKRTTIDDYTKADRVGSVPIAGYKHSLMPLIPYVIKDTALEHLNRMLIDGGIQLAQFKSAVKYGSVGIGSKVEDLDSKGKPQFLDFYNNEGKSTFENNLTVRYQTMDNKHIGIQVDMAPKFKEEVTAGTQFRKLILNNMFEKGIPADFYDKFKLNALLGARGDIERAVATAWDNALEDGSALDLESKNYSEFYANSKEYIDLQNEIYDYHYNKLKKEFGLEYDHKGTLKIGSRDGFFNELIKVMEGEGKTKSEVASVITLRDSKTPIEVLSDTKSFMYMMASIVNSRVIKEKRKGEGSPQAAVTGWENTGKFTRKGTDSFLKTYRYNYNSDRIIPSECIVSLPLNLNAYIKTKYPSSKNALQSFNEDIEKLRNKLQIIEETYSENKEVLTAEEEALKRLITLVGFRIPNQGLSSSDILRVVKFLPTYMGSTIIVPSNMTAKAGSDFDIDKLTIYAPHYKIVNNELIMTNYNGSDTVSAMKSRYATYIDNQKLKSKLESEEMLSLVEELKDIAAFSKEFTKSLKEEQERLYEEFKVQSKEATNKVYNDAKVAKKEKLKIAVSLFRKSINAIPKEIADTLFENSKDLKDTSELSYLVETAEEIIKVINGLNKSVVNIDNNSITTAYVNEVLSSFINSTQDLINLQEGKITLTEEQKEEASNARAELKSKLNEYREITNESSKDLKDSLTKATESIRTKMAEKVRAYKLENASKLGYMTESQFASQSIASQNSIESIQNRMIELQEDIMMHKTQMRQLMSPISDAFFKDPVIGVVWDIRFLSAGTDNEFVKAYRDELKGIKKSDRNYNARKREIYNKYKEKFAVKFEDDVKNNTSWNNMFSTQVNLEKFIAFLSGKLGVGIAALQTTFNALSQQVNLKLAAKHNFNIFAHSIDEKGNVYMSSRVSKDNNLITETISAFVNAYVDVAADPFIFEVNAGLYTAGTMFNMIRQGAPGEWTIRFLNQPIIKEFVRRMNTVESIAARNSGTEEVKTEYDIYNELINEYSIIHRNANTLNVHEFFGPNAKKYKAEEKQHIEQQGQSTVKSDAFSVVADLFQNDKSDTEAVTSDALEEMIIESKRFEHNYKLVNNDGVTSFVTKKDYDTSSMQDRIYLEKQFALLQMYMIYHMQASDMRELSRLSNYDTNGKPTTIDETRKKLESVFEYDNVGKVDKRELVKNLTYVNGSRLTEDTIARVPEKIAVEFHDVESTLTRFFDFENYPTFGVAYKQNVKFMTTKFPAIRSGDAFKNWIVNYQSDFLTAITLAKPGYNPGEVFTELFSRKGKYFNSVNKPDTLVKYLRDIVKIGSFFNKSAYENKQFGLDFYVNLNVLNRDKFEYSEGGYDFIKEILKSLNYSVTLENANEMINFIEKNKVAIAVIKDSNLFNNYVRYKFATDATMDNKDSRIYTYQHMQNKTSIIEDNTKAQIDYFQTNLRDLNAESLQKIQAEMLKLKAVLPELHEDLLRFSINQSGTRVNRLHSMLEVFGSDTISNIKTEQYEKLTDAQLAEMIDRFTYQILGQDIRNYGKPVSGREIEDMQDYANRNESASSEFVENGDALLTYVARNAIEGAKSKTVSAYNALGQPTKITGLKDLFFGVMVMPAKNTKTTPTVEQVLATQDEAEYDSDNIDSWITDKIC